MYVGAHCLSKYYAIVLCVCGAELIDYSNMALDRLFTLFETRFIVADTTDTTMHWYNCSMFALLCNVLSIAIANVAC